MHTAVKTTVDDTYGRIPSCGAILPDETGLGMLADVAMNERDRRPGDRK